MLLCPCVCTSELRKKTQSEHRGGLSRAETSSRLVFTRGNTERLGCVGWVWGVLDGSWVEVGVTMSRPSGPVPNEMYMVGARPGMGDSLVVKMRLMLCGCHDIPTRYI